MTEQRRIVVTGSTRGIGKGLALEFLRRGHSVVVSGRAPRAVEAAASELRPQAVGNAQVVGIACDIAKREEVQKLWDGSVHALGGVDIWINNAGVSPDRQRGGELKARDIERTQEINLLGMMHATQIALRGMNQQPGGGFIYNMEGYGSNGMMNPGMSLYGSSKFALTYFNRCLLAETRRSKVKICYLSPGIVVTDLLKRDMGSNNPKDWERTKRVYNILADRVETVTPWLAEKVLANNKAGARVAWLTGGKAAGRFFMSLFRKRQIVADSDFVTS
jgi:NAD(P)-dependent dehydrogenase (short-subunit alcohol dehydrogenase family)